MILELSKLVLADQSDKLAPGCFCRWISALSNDSKFSLLIFVALILAYVVIASIIIFYSTENSELITAIINASGLIVLSVTLLFTYSAARASAHSADAANKALSHSALMSIAEHPPKLTVVQISLPLISNIPLRGKCLILNEGRHRARVVSRIPKDAILCRVYIYWTALRLPQDHIENLILSEKSVLLQPKWILPGDAIFWRFDSKNQYLTDGEIESIRCGQIDLYVIGLMRYGDDSSLDFGNHRTLFCRKYNNEKDRYLKLDDDSYEYCS